MEIENNIETLSDTDLHQVCGGDEFEVGWGMLVGFALIAGATGGGGALAAAFVIGACLVAYE